MLVAFLGLGLMVGQASADVMCAATRITPIVNNGTVTVIRAFFVTTDINQLVDIKYNAECSIAGVSTNWLNTDIIIDPAGRPEPFVCPPSNSDNALCSGNHTAGVNDGWVSAVTNCVTRIPTVGIHTVRVQVNPVPAGTFWRIDDQSLKCEN
jgi:hypothetical protein